MIDHTREGCQCEGKVCSTCKNVKCHGDFYRNGKHLRSDCKSCKLAADKAFRDANAESINAKRRARRPKRAEVINAQQRASWKTHGKAREERRRMRMAQDPEYTERRRNVSRNARKKYGHIYNAKTKLPANRERERARDRERYYNPKRVEWRETYRKTHSEMFRAYYKAKTYKRRILSRQVGGTFTAQEWKSLKKFYDYTCLRCGRKEPDIVLCADHVIPLSKNGTNSIENRQPLCIGCNSRKGTKSTDYRTKEMKNATGN